jgi:hypothetical protein
MLMEKSDERGGKGMPPLGFFPLSGREGLFLLVLVRE